MLKVLSMYMLYSKYLTFHKNILFMKTKEILCLYIIVVNEMREHGVDL